MFRQGQLAVHGLAILLGRNEAGISKGGKFFFVPRCNLYTVQGGFNTVIEASIGRDVWFVLMKVGSPPSSLILTNLRPKPDNAH